eukprot:GHVP01020403.1.p1 GENE.GHVP01020403.1~~GHVP01020403.1.p1  ORF type:complete len:372 (-),score=69.59 GHVP01020403.1:8-1123(-)
MKSLLLLLSILICILSKKKCLYSILGVSKDASDSEIKSKYRKLAVKLHPDKNKDNPDASTEFADISHAYQVLSDKEKRKSYDLHGEEGPAAGQGGFDPFDLFKNSGFGGFGGFNFGGDDDDDDDERASRPKTIRARVGVSLKDIFKGSTKTFNLSRTVICGLCEGSGAKNKKDLIKCNVCKGKGMKIQQILIGGMFTQQVQTACTACNGVGKKIKNKCTKCMGAGKVEKDGELKIKVEKGADEGEEIIFPRMANEEPGSEPGDLIVVIAIENDRDFKRNGKNLETKVTITLLEALVGFTKKVKLPGGETFIIKRDSIVKPGERESFQGRGIPYRNSTRRGSLTVEYNIIFPNKIENKNKVKEAFASPKIDL